CEFTGERGEVGLLGQQEHTGFGTELAGPEGGRLGVPGQDLVTARGRGCAGDEDGVDAAEFTVEGDRVGAGDGEVVQGAAARDRTGETDRASEGVGDGEAPGLHALDEREGAVRRPGLGEGDGDEVGGAAGESEVAGVGLDDDGEPGRERVGGVAASGGEGEGKMTGSENHDGPERQYQAAYVGAGCAPVRVGGVDGDAEEASLLEHVREEAELEGG